MMGRHAARWRVVACVCAIAVAAAAGDRPNILFILSDDQRADAIAALGNEEIITPNLDALVARGVVFDRAYCMGSNSGAVCAPSRAMMLTGQSLEAVKPHIWDVPEALVTLPELLRAAGYETFFTGKWHSGEASLARGFTAGGSIFFGGMGSHTELLVHDFDPAGVYENGGRKRLHAFSSTAFVEEAIGFLRHRDQTRPFFAMVSFTAPHDPRTPPAEERALYDERALSLPVNFMPVHPFHNGEMTIRDEGLAPWPRTEEDTRRQIADYYAMITQMDGQIGRLLAALDEGGLAEETVIVFASDHGLAIGSHGLMGKQNLYEHSARAPMVWAGPGIGEGVHRSELVYLLDIMPTLCGFAGVEAPEGVLGLSLRAMLGGGEEVDWPRRSIMLAYTDVQRAVVERSMKLIVYPKINRLQLFDLSADPGELNDLASDPARRADVDRLLGELEGWRRRVGDTAPLRSNEPRSPRFDHVHAERVRRGG